MDEEWAIFSKLKREREREREREWREGVIILSVTHRLKERDVKKNKKKTKKTRSKSDGSIGPCPRQTP